MPGARPLSFWFSYTSKQASNHGSAPPPSPSPPPGSPFVSPMDWRCFFRRTYKQLTSCKGIQIRRATSHAHLSLAWVLHIGQGPK